WESGVAVPARAGRCRCAVPVRVDRVARRAPLRSRSGSGHRSHRLRRAASPESRPTPSSSACRPCPPRSGPSSPRLDSASLPVSSDARFWVFHSWNLSARSPLLVWSPCLHQPPLPTAFPSPPGCRLLGHVAFATLGVLRGGPTTRPALLPTSLALIGSLPSVPSENESSPPGVTSWSSIPCRPQTPWYGG